MVSRSLVSFAHDACRPQQRYSKPRPRLPYILLFITATILLIILAHIPCAKAALRNASIDDIDGDELTGHKPWFVPAAGSWDGVHCTACLVLPDPAFAYRNTYTAATYRQDEGTPLVEFSFQFTGECTYMSWIVYMEEY